MPYAIAIIGYAINSHAQHPPIIIIILVGSDGIHSAMKQVAVDQCLLCCGIVFSAVSDFFSAVVALHFQPYHHFFHQLMNG